VTAGPRFLSPEGKPRAFVVVSSARSGSNLLVGYLRQVRQVACLGEIFRDAYPGSPGWDKLVERLGLPRDAADLHARDVTAFWELVVEQGLRRRGWVGAKAFYYHRRGERIWDRFGEDDHRVIHLWRDATFEQYVSRLLAVSSGEWKSPGRASDPPGEGSAEEPARLVFDRADYLAYRSTLRTDVEWARERFGTSGRYVELEYRQLLDHGFVADLLEQLFGERIDVTETLRPQRSRPKIEYLANPEAGEPFVADSIRGGFAGP
jgi:LPS sulfotransferase NodH